MLTLAACAEMSRAELLLGLYRYGVTQLVERTENTLVFRYASESLGFEADEASDQEWISHLTAQHDSELAKELRAVHESATATQKGSVRRWRGDFIAYDADPDSDAHFAKLGILAARQASGQDTFPGDTQFGGLAFNLFRGAVGALVGWALKHESFCHALLAKHDDMHMRNILTITAPLKRLELGLATQLGITLREARIAIEMVTARDENKDNLRESGPSPMFVEVGCRRVVRSIAGSTTQPFYFMLRELKRRFSGDWDRAVDSREVALRQELYTVGLPLGLLALNGSRNLKMGKIVTDVDAALADPRNGVIALFQLKWQDPFGYSMRERESRKKNFMATANKWVQVVAQWQEDKTPSQVASTLGLSNADATRIAKVLLFVVARDHSHFTGSVPHDSRAAFGNWNQMLRALTVEHPSRFAGNPLVFLWEELRGKTEIGPRRKKTIVEEVHVGNLTLSVVP